MRIRVVEWHGEQRFPATLIQMYLICCLVRLGLLFHGRRVTACPSASTSRLKIMNLSTRFGDLDSWPALPVSVVLGEAK